ncbi:hypothetical protein COS54_01105 [Candidatus Shapirobacteria bacterium CG03_land_8_20_14_0_80_39_12]|uniref:Uncharacterized protein n=1 Tax=Candidatus Shapirobacteria bacterium CG03_land_8_20_14_0_80_39_12 TaxID=1974879 RepID=A0A2M7BE82_9BACT|nr:MAG: hypothetical protein COS54_01105 [Candidatus Shapirobacteria bacterium CG03_land_8_20_14_0_80_39_12]
MNILDNLIPAERKDRFKFNGLDLYMPRMAKAKTMLVGNPKSSIAICTSWDDPELVLTEAILEKVALVAPLRSTYGVNILLANLGLNPQINKVIFLRGGDFDETETGSLPKKVINLIWKDGIDPSGKVMGTDLSLLEEIASKEGIKNIQKITKDVEIIDWEGKDEKRIKKLEEKIDEFLKKASKKPGRSIIIFPDFKVEEVETYPSETTAHEIREKTPALAWLRLIDRIIRYGQTAVLETKEGTQIRELPFERVTIENLETEKFAVPKWLSGISEVKITPEELEAYYQRFIKPDSYYQEIYPGVKKFIRPPTDKYLYCELLFAFPRPKEIDLAAEYVFSKEGINGVFAFLSEKFPQDEVKLKLANKVLADKKITDEEKTKVLLEIFRPAKNQIAEMQKRLKEIGSDTDKTLILWDPNVHSFLYSGRPCWVEAAALLRDGKLNFKAVFRSHDIAKGWLKNVYGIYRLVEEYLAKPIGVKIGTITIESESGHIYLADLTWVKKLWQEQVKEKGLLTEVVTDPRGNVLISLEGKEVEVILASPVDGRPIVTFKGKPKEVLKQIIGEDLLFEGSHWAYLGRELTKVEECIKKSLPYIQDKV